LRQKAKKEESCGAFPWAYAHGKGLAPFQGLKAQGGDEEEEGIEA
jgi:hypothetical protein